MPDSSAVYSHRLEALTGEKAKLDKIQRPLPMFRLALFLGMALLIYFYLATQTLWTALPAGLIFIIFIAVTAYDSKLKRLIKRTEILIDINNKELNSIRGDYGPFDPGNEFVNPSHDYTHDLDVFGQGSMFQFINRSATIFGKQRLADYFSNAFGYSKKVIQRQEAVKELSGMIDFRQDLQLLFHDELITASDKDEMNQWLESESPVRNIKLLKALAYGLPSLTVACIFLSIFNIISFPVLLILVQLMIVFIYAGKTLKVQQVITSKSKILNRYAQCLHMLEKNPFRSGYMIDLQKQINTGTGQSASMAIRQLSSILKYMDSNLNLLVSLILNGLFMFNLHLLLKAEKWKSYNKLRVPDWFDSIASLDAMSSLANFAYNHRDFTFPQMQDDSFRFEAKSLGHPLIASAERVVNDVDIKGWNQFYIITGANMSGKSTFLRTIGVNYLLAMAGAPVCAKELHFYPIEIHSSIRTSDSLMKHESYFYAELKRLKQIIDELESGKQKLILLDEILKGTNSKDKQAGSIALIEQLLHYKSVGLFATHDLMLGELAKSYPDHVNNLCFEIEIEEDKMVIDYKLHRGICKNLNATFLMKNMGILFEKQV